MRVVVDTNVLVSNYLNPKGTPARLMKLLEERRFTMLVSDDILEEYRKTMLRDHLVATHRLTNHQIAIMIATFREEQPVIVSERIINAVPNDSDDDIFIECAVSGGADFIVSGDRHLLSIGEYRGIRIITAAMFVSYLETFPELA